VAADPLREQRIHRSSGGSTTRQSSYRGSSSRGGGGVSGGGARGGGGRGGEEGRDDPNINPTSISHHEKFNKTIDVEQS
jgi:hypothetical protein